MTNNTAALAASPAAQPEPGPSADQMLTDEQWYDIAMAHANHDWTGPGFLDSIKSVGRAILAAHPAAPQPAPAMRADGVRATVAMPWNGPVNKDGTPAPIQSMTVDLTTGKTTYDDGTHGVDSVDGGKGNGNG